MGHNEQNHAEREQVYLQAVVGPAFLDFGRHVGECSSVALQVVNLFLTGKSEVDKLDIALTVVNNILKLEISVGNFLLVHVLNSVDHLVGEVTANVLTHCRVSLADVKEQASVNKLHD